MPENTETETAWMEGYSKGKQDDNAEGVSLIYKAMGALHKGNHKVAMVRLENALEALK